MRFGSWAPLPQQIPQAVALAPPGPGLFQVRLRDHLRRYPTGHSAMVAYGGGADLPAAVRDFLRHDPAGQAALRRDDLLCRFAALDAHHDADAALARLRAQFAERFGAPPKLDLPGP